MRSKKISCADVNTLTLLSIWDVYGGGLTNLQRSFANTPYSGTYGPTLDTGITASGLLGHFYRSDKRGHGSMTLSTDMADKIAARLAHAHHVEVGEKKYALAPINVRGIPHGYVPGLHSVCVDMVAALEHVAEYHGRAHNNTREGLFALPFSAFTQVHACTLTPQPLTLCRNVPYLAMCPIVPCAGAASRRRVDRR